MPITTIDIKRILSLKLSDWIHTVQTLFRTNKSITTEAIKNHPKVQWNKYDRIIELVDFSADVKNNTFVCKFKIKEPLIEDGTKIHTFNQTTVPSQFSV